jgi:phosphoglycerol transferase MdoB-like AlkP superfamily enzyme
MFKGASFFPFGLPEYYDEEYFGTEDYFLIGATDEVLYGKTFEKLQEFSASDQPFYVNVISMTSHHPFDLPEEKRRIELPERFDNTFINDYLTSVHYADYALGNFITSLKASGMWDKSLIVTYGDHSGVHHSKISDEDKALLAELIGREYWFVDRLNIPLFITAPGELEPKVVTNVGGQIDMMPTIANLIGLSLDDQIHFGQDILNEEDNLLGMRYYLAKGSLFNPEVLLTPEGDNGTAYDLDTGAIVGERSDHQDDFNRVITLLDLSDAYLDSLPQR